MYEKTSQKLFLLTTIFISTVLTHKNISEKIPIGIDTDVDIEGIDSGNVKFSIQKVAFYFRDRNNVEPLAMTKENIYMIDDKKPIKYLIHGWLNDAQHSWVETLSQAYLKKYDYQIILVDWKYGASVDFLEAVENVKNIGFALAEHILSSKISLDKVHLIGHSLGAHVAGFAGKAIINLTGGNKIGRISGLDPAGPIFDQLSKSKRLNDEDAIYVDITHTDAGITGSNLSLGTVDFWANGGTAPQPGCPDNLGDVYKPYYNIARLKVLCSHFRATFYFIKSVEDDDILAYKCPQYLWYALGLCKGTEAISYGENVDLSSKGNFYFDLNYPTIKN